VLGLPPLGVVIDVEPGAETVVGSEIHGAGRVGGASDGGGDEDRGEDQEPGQARIVAEPSRVRSASAFPQTMIGTVPPSALQAAPVT
jgi:hypothetical protein